MKWRRAFTACHYTGLGAVAVAVGASVVAEIQGDWTPQTVSFVVGFAYPAGFVLAAVIIAALWVYWVAIGRPGVKPEPLPDYAGPSWRAQLDEIRDLPEVPVDERDPSPLRGDRS